MGHNGGHNYTRVTHVDPFTPSPDRWGRRISTPEMKEVTVTARTANRPEGAGTRGILYVHSAPSALCPHIEWAVGGVLGLAVNLDWTPQPAQSGHLPRRAVVDRRRGLRGRGRLRPARLEPSPVRDHRGADGLLRGRPLLLHPRARRLPRRDRPARRHHDPRGPAQGRGGEVGARRHHPARSRSTSCSASRGTTSSRPSGTPARARRCGGCTRWSEAAQGAPHPEVRRA